MKPILFNTDMVRAILEGRKTVTRRVIKPRPPAGSNVAMDRYEWNWAWWKDGEHHRFVQPYYPGDVLYVRETWAHPSEAEIAAGTDRDMFLYKADSVHPAAWGKWRPSIHMPRAAARLFLRVTGVRVERLQDIDGAGSEAEGALVVLNPVIRYDKAIYDKFGKKEFKQIWDSTIKTKDRDMYAWPANPWVWVIEFERISREEAERCGT